MERIFGRNSDYSEETQNELKQVMLVSDQDRTDISIYGKTGMGKANGIVVLIRIGNMIRIFRKSFDNELDKFGAAPAQEFHVDDVFQDQVDILPVASEHSFPDTVPGYRDRPHSIFHSW